MAQYREMFLRTFDFKGKSGIRDFWLCVLINLVFCYALSIFALPFANDKTVLFRVIEGLANLYEIIVFLPMLSLTIRRLRDSGHSAWTLLLIFIPIFGIIILFYYLAMPTVSKLDSWGTGQQNAEQSEQEKNYGENENLNFENANFSGTDNLQSENVKDKPSESTKVEAESIKTDTEQEAIPKKIDESKITISEKPKTRSEQIKELQAKRDAGIITNEEYEKELFKVLTR